MRWIWNEQTIRWFLDASAYTGFHKALAKMILPHLRPEDTLCDAGCGLGRLDLELAPHVTAIKAIDMNAQATGVLAIDAQSLGFDNLRVVTGDAMDQSEPFDILLISFFGKSNLLDLRRLHRRKIIRVVSADKPSSLYPERFRCKEKETVRSVCGQLDALGAQYILELGAAEFGQPLRTRSDAELYVLQNAPAAAPDEVDEFLNECLKPTSREDFPYYLPFKKEFGIFIFDCTP